MEQIVCIKCVLGMQESSGRNRTIIGKDQRASGDTAFCHSLVFVGRTDRSGVNMCIRLRAM